MLLLLLLGLSLGATNTMAEDAAAAAVIPASETSSKRELARRGRGGRRGRGSRGGNGKPRCNLSGYKTMVIDAKAECEATCGDGTTSSPTTSPTNAPTDAPTNAPTNAPTTSPTSPPGEGEYEYEYEYESSVGEYEYEEVELDVPVQGNGARRSLRRKNGGGSPIDLKSILESVTCKTETLKALHETNLEKCKEQCEPEEGEEDRFCLPKCIVGCRKHLFRGGLGDCIKGCPAKCNASDKGGRQLRPRWGRWPPKRQPLCVPKCLVDNRPSLEEIRKALEEANCVPTECERGCINDKRVEWLKERNCPILGGL